MICSHPNTELRLRTIAGGSTVIYRQCTTCGESIGGAVSKASAPDWQKLPPYTEELRETYRQAQREEHKVERAIALVEHTQRYRDYLTTPAWKRKCEMVYERENGQCQGCRQAQIHETHHLTYAHVFDELLFELAGLCSPCHRRVHGLAE